MSTLRSKLIRLAHARPELRKDLMKILSKEASKIPYSDYAFVEEAMIRLLNDAKVPRDVDVDALLNTGTSRVRIPVGFQSLFKNLEINFSLKSGRVSWGYAHPSGGSNGLTIGAIFLDKKKNVWVWHCEATGNHGEVAPF